MNQVVECVVNFSEGRNPDTLRALVAAVRNVSGVAMLDETMDPDHHRSVLTFAGRPYAVAEAAFQATRLASQLIDLRTHHGVHPRIGATDVVPFVPIRDVSMEDCVELAKLVGQRIGNELKIPVFLYEEAAGSMERRRLEVIRRGGLSGIAERMDCDRGWAPDFGPRQVHETAGVTVVGARWPLIAFNVNLQSNDLSIARRIAETVRESGGGLPYVKAIGVALASRGLVQVSMNLTNFEKTPVHIVFEAVRREAQGHGVGIAGTELVGLVPQQALIQLAGQTLQLERFERHAIIEAQLEQAESRDAIQRPTAGVQKSLGASLAEVSAAVSAKAPAITGAGAAALAASLAATLGVMLARLNRSRSAEQRLQQIRTRLHELVQIDRGAYAAVLQADKIASTASGHDATAASARIVAAQVPLEIATLSCEAARLLQTLVHRARPDVRPDLKIGLQLARAVIDGCLDIVQENLKNQPDQQFLRAFQRRVATAEQKLVDLKALCYTPPSDPWSQKILNKLKLR